MKTIVLVIGTLTSLISFLPVGSHPAIQERYEDREECWCGLFRPFKFENMIAIEQTVGESCNAEGDDACSERCALLSNTLHLQYTLLDKICKVYVNANKIMMGIVSRTCEDRAWIDVGLRNAVSCRNGSYTDSTIPMDMIDKLHVLTDKPQTA